MTNNNLSIAIIAALKAGEAIMKIYSTDFNVEFKDDKSPLTIADKKANEAINAILATTEISIISEENKQLDYSIRKHWKTCWMVDPLDGTKEFIKRNGEFTVNIALIANGQPILGIIYAPVFKTLYYADVIKQKAYKCELSSHATDLEEVYSKCVSIHQKKEESNVIRIVGSRSHMNKETLDFIDQQKHDGKDTEVISIGSSLKFCIVAERKADVYPRFAPTMEWDTAAGHAICNAVGINVISTETKQPISYNKERLLNPGFIVS